MIGIYAIYWLNTGKVYVGQSINVSQRINRHFHELKNNIHYNRKLQEEYNKDSDCNFIILEECNINELNNKEIFWSKELNTELNIIACGNSGGNGLNASGSKYTKIQILKVFRYITRSKRLRNTEISKLTGVSTDTIGDISKGLTHLWLLEKYPFNYSKIKQPKPLEGENGSTSKYSNIKILRVFSLLYKTKNSLSSISKATGVHPSTIQMILSGDNHKWLKDKYPEKYKSISKIRSTKSTSRYLIHPTEGIVEVLNTMEFINKHLKQYGLSINTMKNEMARLFNGKREEYKGWRRQG